MRVNKVVPWQKIGKEVVVAISQDKKLTIQRFKNPSTGKIQAFHRYIQPNWSIILPITDNGKVITCRQYYQGVEQILQHLPGGNADFTKENPYDVAKRELLEETGYEAQEVIFLGTIPLSARNSTTMTSLFLALGCKNAKNVPLDKDELIEIVIEKLEDWVLKTFTEIRETPSMVATHLALPWLRKKFDVDLNKILDLAYSQRSEKETLITSRS